MLAKKNIELLVPPSKAALESRLLGAKGGHNIETGPAACTRAGF